MTTVIESKEWTLETLIIDAQKYQHRSDWSSANRSAYDTARKNRVLDLCCAHMTRKPLPAKWTQKACIEDAKKYQYRSEWSSANQPAYAAAQRLGILDICCAHMTRKPKTLRWTLEACMQDAAEYSTRSEWYRFSASAYAIASKNQWLDLCCQHMPAPKETCKTAQLERCIQAASRYTRRTHWAKGDSATYLLATRNNWLDQCCQHMLPPNFVYWTKEACLAEAKKHANSSQWRAASPKSYSAAVKHRWLQECKAHMTRKVTWDKQTCIAEASKHSSESDWRKHSIKSYKAARYNGWFEECTQHMTKALS